MTKNYNEIRSYILTCNDFDSLNEIAGTAYDACNTGTVTDEEYIELQKLLNCVVKKGVEYINTGL